MITFFRAESRRFLLLFSLFIGIPLLFSAWAGWHAVSIARDRHREHVRERLEQRLGELVRKSDPQVFFAHVGADFQQRLQKQPITPISLADLTRHCQQDWAIDFEPFCFDASGTLIPVEGQSARSRDLMQVSWNVMLKRPVQRYNVAYREAKTLFGVDFEFGKLRSQPGIPLPIYGKDGDGLLIYAPGKREGTIGTLLALWTKPPLEPLIRRMAAQEEFRDLAVCLDARLSRTEAIEIMAGDPQRYGITVLQAPSESASPDWGKKYLWSMARLRDLRLLIGIPLSFSLYEFLLVALLLAIIGGLSLFWRWSRAWYEQWGRTFLSIRTKLLSMFFYITVCSVLGLGLLGFLHLENRRDVRSSHVLKAGQEALANLDMGFLEERRNSLQFFRTLRDHPLRRRGFPELQVFLNTLEKRDILSWCELRDVGGNLLLTTEDPETTKKIGIIARVLAKICIGFFLQDRLVPGRTEKIQPTEVIIQSIFDSHLVGWTNVIHTPDAIHEMRFGRFNLFWYWDYYRSPVYPEATFQISRKLEPLMQEYLGRALQQRVDFEQHAFRTLAFHQNTREYLPRGVEPFPELRAFIDRAGPTSEFTATTVTNGPDEYIAMAFPGKYLKNHLLVAWFPVEGVELPVARIRDLLLLGGVFALAFALLIGVTLSETFLQPIAELLRGVKALHERNTQVRIPVGGRDELGDLALAFNRTMEDVKELLFAQAIQARLMPSTVGPYPGYDIDLVNISATDLGGDYCDAVPMKDNRCLFAIGDVTGHGVSSALVMAMAKSSVFTAVHDDVPLLTLMERLNRLLCRLLKRKKLMTFFAMTLDTTTGALQFSNAGHPLPILCDATGECRRLEICRAPLGFSERGVFELGEAELPAGGVLLLYTDGALEMRNAAGQPWGYPRLEEFLRQHRHLPATELRERLVAELRAFSPQPELDDDITFIVIKRRKSPISCPADGRFP
jgi:HAMP domain-containing protein